MSKRLHELTHTELQQRVMDLKSHIVTLNIQLNSVRFGIAQVQVDAASARYHALRWAAEVAQMHCVYEGDEKEYPSAIGAQIADKIVDEMRRCLPPVGRG